MCQSTLCTLRRQLSFFQASLVFTFVTLSFLRSVFFTLFISYGVACFLSFKCLPLWFLYSPTIFFLLLPCFRRFFNFLSFSFPFFPYSFYSVVLPIFFTFYFSKFFFNFLHLRSSLFHFFPCCFSALRLAQTEWRHCGHSPLCPY